MYTIGVTGGTGSGKTTLVSKLLSGFSKNQVTIIPQDAYYLDRSHLSYEERCKVNYDHPEAIAFDRLADDLKKLQNGRSVERPVYSFKKHNREKKTVTLSPTPVVILEGILILHEAEIRKLLDVSIYTYAPDDVRVVRRLKRDIAERGRDVNEVTDRYLETLKPMHDKFIAPSGRRADLTVNTNRNTDAAVAALRELIHRQVNLSK